MPLANVVLPVPGGPKRTIARGGETAWRAASRGSCAPAPVACQPVNAGGLSFGLGLIVMVTVAVLDVPLRLVAL